MKDQERQDAVTAGRLLHTRKAYSSLYDYLARLPSITARRDNIDTLTAVIPSKFASSSLFARLAPVDQFLKHHSALIFTSQNQGIPADGPAGITALLLQEHQECPPQDSGKLGAALALPDPPMYPKVGGSWPTRLVPSRFTIVMPDGSWPVVRRSAPSSLLCEQAAPRICACSACARTVVHPIVVAPSRASPATPPS
jgi:hypothetical protein